MLTPVNWAGFDDIRNLPLPGSWQGCHSMVGLRTLCLSYVRLYMLGLVSLMCSSRWRVVVLMTNTSAKLTSSFSCSAYKFSFHETVSKTHFVCWCYPSLYPWSVNALNHKITHPHKKQINTKDLHYAPVQHINLGTSSDIQLLKLKLGQDSHIVRGLFSPRCYVFTVTHGLLPSGCSLSESTCWVRSWMFTHQMKSKPLSLMWISRETQIHVSIRN